MQLTHNEVPGGGQNKICQSAILVQLARLLCLKMAETFQLPVDFLRHIASLGFTID